VKKKSGASDEGEGVSRLQDGDTQPAPGEDRGDSKKDGEDASKDRENDKDGRDSKDKDGGKSDKDSKAAVGKDAKDDGKSQQDRSLNRGKAKDEAITPATSARAVESFSLTEKFSYSLDTKKHKDGPYIVRLTLSDRPSNALEAQSTVVFRSIVIDNGEPDIDSVVVKKIGAGRLSVRLTAHDAISAISDCVCKIDDGEGFALSSPAGGGPLSDASRVVFVGDNVPFEGPAKKLTVQVFDRAGNSAKKTVSLL
jgi:hypothetical protein